MNATDNHPPASSPGLRVKRAVIRACIALGVIALTGQAAAAVIKPHDAAYAIPGCLFPALAVVTGLAYLRPARRP